MCMCDNTMDVIILVGLLVFTELCKLHAVRL